MPKGRPLATRPVPLAQVIAGLREHLGRRPANVPVWLGRAALPHLAAHEAQQAELAALRADRERLAQLIDEYNAIWDAAREAGAEVFQLAGSSDAWHWMRGDRRGQAGTPGAALVAALAENAPLR